MRRTMLAALAVLPLAVSLPGPGSAQVGRWVPLGHHTVTVVKPDHDVVTVGNVQGYFTHIDIKVSRNSVHFYDVTVIYGNNERDHLQVRRLVPAGQSTGPLQLDLAKYRQRAIKEIHLSYQSGSWFKGRAQVEIVGKQG